MSTLHLALTSANDLVAALPMNGIPDPTAARPPGMESIDTVLNWGKWVALIICVGALIAAGALMAFNSRRGEGGEHVGRIASALFGAGTMIGFLAT
jgi:hypothetical protein